MRGSCAFFYQLSHGHARNARGPHDAALRIALDQELIYLGVAHDTPRARRVHVALEGARLALVLGIAPATAVLAYLLAAAPSA